MVFITLWLQLLGFSDFAASLLMALFALGSALGGLLGGAIGEALFKSLKRVEVFEGLLVLRPRMVLSPPQTLRKTGLQLNLIPMQALPSTAADILQGTGRQRQHQTGDVSWPRISAWFADCP